MDIHECGALVSQNVYKVSEKLADSCARGESGVGKWTIIVKDTIKNKHHGTFTDWHLKLWGESRDPSKAKLLPMPTEEDDDDHAVIPTITAPAATTTVEPNPAGGKPEITSIATDIPDRPVNTKPTQTDGPSPPSASQDEQTADPTATNSTWLPSFLPTLGVSASTQAWIYGSLTLIIIFCCGLGVYLWIARRKRLRNSARDNYEFELLDEEETEGLASGEKLGAAGRRGRKTRGGELYDAFAGGSDDEDDDFESTDQYRDRADEISPRVSEKRDRAEVSDDEEGHHVVGDDDEEDSDSEERPLHQGSGR